MDYLSILNNISHDCHTDAAMYGNNDNTPSHVIDTYGELLPVAVHDIIETLDIKPKDVFYDLGCGSGRICLQVYIEKGIKSIGIEYVKKRYDKAMCHLKNLQTKYKRTKQVQFINGDFLRCNIETGTIFYICNTCFNDTFMCRILNKIHKESQIRYLIVLRDIPDKCKRKFVHVTTIPAKTSWSENSSAHIYKRV